MDLVDPTVKIRLLRALHGNQSRLPCLCSLQHSVAPNTFRASRSRPQPSRTHRIFSRAARYLPYRNRCCPRSPPRHITDRSGDLSQNVLLRTRQTSSALVLVHPRPQSAGCLNRMTQVLKSQSHLSADRNHFPEIPTSRTSRRLGSGMRC